MGRRRRAPVDGTTRGHWAAARRGGGRGPDAGGYLRRARRQTRYPGRAAAGATRPRPHGLRFPDVRALVFGRGQGSGTSGGRSTGPGPGRPCGDGGRSSGPPVRRRGPAGPSASAAGGLPVRPRRGSGPRFCEPRPERGGKLDGSLEPARLSEARSQRSRHRPRPGTRGDSPHYVPTSHTFRGTQRVPSSSLGSVSRRSSTGRASSTSWRRGGRW